MWMDTKIRGERCFYFHKLAMKRDIIEEYVKKEEKGKL